MATSALKLVVAVFALLLIVPAHSADSDDRAENLLRQCTSSDTSSERLVCLSYLNGVLDGAVVMQVYVQKPKLCLPDEGVSMEQYRRIVVKWLGDRPNVLHESKRIHAVKALIDAFPCKE